MCYYIVLDQNGCVYGLFNTQHEAEASIRRTWPKATENSRNNWFYLDSRPLVRVCEMRLFNTEVDFEDFESSPG